MPEQKYLSYRWVMLGLAWLISVFQAWGFILVSPLGKQLMTDLDMNHTIFMAVVGAPEIISIFLALPGGILADKFGMKKMIIISGIIGGVFGILRGVSVNYVQFFAFSFIMGFGRAIMMPNLAKLVRDWFPRHQIGIATGIYVTGMSAGLTLGLGLTYPLFGFDWRLAIYVTGGILMVFVFLWYLLAREAHNEPAKWTIIKDLSQIVRNRDVWMTGFLMLFSIGGVLAFVRLFPVALQEGWSIDPAVAGAIASLNAMGALSGNILMPFLSDRFGLRRPFLIFLPVLGALSLYLVWNSPFGFSTWLFAYLVGVFIGGVGPMSMAVITEHPNMPAKLVGTAMGFRTVLSSAGTYLMGLLGGYIVDWTHGYDMAFLIFAIMISTGLVFGFLTSETGSKERHAAVLH